MEPPIHADERRLQEAIQEDARKLESFTDSGFCFFSIRVHLHSSAVAF